MQQETDLVRVRQEAGPDPQSRQPDFTATAPDQLWPTDIAGQRSDEGKLYLCAIKDVYSNRIAGYSIDSRMKAFLAVSALHNVMGLRDPAGTVVHSDRGSQLRSNAFVRTLQGNWLKGSMGRVGACADNAAWNRSSHSCRRTCWIASDGPQERI